LEEPTGRTPHAPPRTFDEVYRDERPKLVRTAYLIVRSQHVAEELVHDGFVRLHQNFAEVERPGGFLHTAVVHLCLTWLKRRDMEQDRLRRLDEPVDAEAEPDELWDAIGRLDPDRRVVVVLRYYQDLSYEQIAEVIGCPIGTVRSRLNRGVADLRREIER
jgi:RNA polymerase sigma factor (sigma-70 family)